MVTKYNVIIPIYYWIPFSCSGPIIVIISGYILMFEIKIRRCKSQQITFISKYAKFFSIIALILPVLTGLYTTVWFLNGFCHLSGFYFVQGVMTPISIGFYQLQRLYHCFAQDKSYSNNGYPRWLFIVMYFIGAYHIISNGICFPYRSLRTVEQCGINDEYQYFEVHRENNFTDDVAQYIISSGYMVYIETVDI